MPTGDGVTNSPSSPLISAMTPANGAWSCVRSRCAFVTSTRASATRVASSAAAHAAAVDSRAAFGLIGRFLGREPIRAQLRRALGVAFGDVGDDARLARARPRRARVALATSVSSALMSVVPELEQQRAGFDALAVLDGQVRDLAAERGRQAGAAARVDGSGAGVRDGRGDGAAFGGDERHGDGLGPRDEPRARRARRRRAPR